jgi:hypothetical protein
MSNAGFVNAAAKESLKRAGTPMVAHTPTTKGLTVVCIVFFGAVMVCAALFAPQEEAGIWILFTPFLLLGLILAAEAFFSRVTYDDACIYARSLWRGRRRIPWSAVERCDYGQTNQWYRIHAGGHGVLRLSVMMWGLADFLRRLPCPHPGYPPVNALGQLMYDAGPPQDWPASLMVPGPPVRVKRVVGKVMLAFFPACAAAAMAFWALSPDPADTPYRRLEGRLTEITRRKVDRREFYLQLRMDSTPVALRIQSQKASRAHLQHFEADARPGDMITVTVSEDHWREPRRPFLGRGEPFMAVVGLDHKGAPIITLSQHLRRQAAEMKLMPWFAVFFLGFGIFIWWHARRRLRRILAAEAACPELA